MTSGPYCGSSVVCEVAHGCLESNESKQRLDVLAKSQRLKLSIINLHRQLSGTSELLLSLENPS